MRKKRVPTGLLDGLGKIWASPYTIIGLLYGFLGMGAGLLAFRLGWNAARPVLLLGNNALQFLHNPLTLPYAAITLGNTISYGRGTAPEQGGAYGDSRVNIGRHEAAHTLQYQLLGPLFIPVYFLCGGLSGPARNPLEQAAQNFGCGQGSWWPWAWPRIQGSGHHCEKS